MNVYEVYDTETKTTIRGVVSELCIDGKQMTPQILYKCKKNNELYHKRYRITLAEDQTRKPKEVSYRKPRGIEEVRKTIKPEISINEMNRRAIEMGMSYGQYQLYLQMEADKKNRQQIEKQTKTVEPAKDYSINEEWISPKDDEPQMDVHYKGISVAIDILLLDGRIHKDGFYNFHDNRYYTINGKRIADRIIQGWRTRV